MSLPTNYNIIWFKDGSLYTLVKGDTRITISASEAEDEGYPIIYTHADIDEAVETGERFAISSGKLTELLGIL